MFSLKHNFPLKHPIATHTWSDGASFPFLKSNLFGALRMNHLDFSCLKSVGLLGLWMEILMMGKYP